MDTEANITMYHNRIQELLDKLDDRNSDSVLSSRAIVDGCYIGTIGVAESLYGPQSVQVKSLIELKKASERRKQSPVYGTIDYLADSLIGILVNMQEELDSGLIKNLKIEMTGEIIGDLVILARNEAKAGFFLVAAVLASAGLEDSIKSIAENIGINTKDKTLDNLINALKAKSFFKGAQVPVITSYVKLRNAAMHADWDSIQEAEVNSLIAFLESFILDYLK
jgi:ribosomal protein L12E/L44/L45/RPP1/RPP2